MFKKIKLLIVKLQTKISKLINSALQHTHDHYRCFFPKNPGKISSAILRLFFSGIRLDKEQISVIKNIPENSIIVYANKYKSYFEYFFYHTRYAQEELPVPEIGFDYKIFWFQPLSRMLRIILANFYHFLQRFRLQDPYSSGYIRQELKKGKTGFLSLVEERGFYLRFVKSNPDPLKYLLEMQNSVECPIFIVPNLVFYSKKPHRSSPGFIDMLFGSQENPGKLRRFVALLKKPESVFVEIAEPVNLKEFIEHDVYKNLNTGEQALVLRRQLLVKVNRHRQSITGPVLKSRAEIKENILTNEQLRDFMEHYAETRKLPIQKVRKEADSYIDEIAAKYSLNIIQVFAMAVKWITDIMFEGVSVNTDVLSSLKTMSRKGPLIFVPCHKSHIDYLILSYLMYQNDMPCPHIAAGKNLSFWPLGPIFRGGGAFFIRRTFRGAVLYSKVFSEYIFKLLSEGFHIEFFIEGGRSRTGKLLQPKLGLLSILLNGYKMGACEDMIFVPVFIGYDRVPEEAAYISELEGGQKNPESLKQVIKARKLLKKRYGRIYIQFHEGISMNDLMEEKGTSIQEMTSKQQNALCRSLGNRIINSIDKVTVITPHAIVASAILNTSKPRFSYEHLMDNINIYMKYLTNQKAKLADTLLVDDIHAFDYVIESYINRKFIEPLSKEDDADKQFTINSSKRPALGYYKNNCVSAFIPGAITAMAILDKDAFQFSGSDIYEDYGFLQDFFKYEFSFDDDIKPEYLVHKNLKAFINDAILMPHPTLPDTYNLTSAGYRKLKLFGSFLSSYFESYLIVLNFLMRYPKGFIDNKDRLKKIHSTGNKMFKKQEIERPEALSRINYKNGLDFFSSQRLKGSEDEEKIEFYKSTILRYLDRLHP